MITTAEALQLVMAATTASATENVPVSEATGRVLRQTVLAERDQPPFDRVMMDGIALRLGDFESGQRRFPIQAMQAAGDAVLSIKDGHCIEIMTGAARPEGADCIVPVERITTKAGSATIDSDFAARSMRFIHPRGSDYHKGDELLHAGKPISPMDIAIIASCGLTDVAVAAQARTCIISTGNELVAAGQAIEDQQIRISNGPAIQSLLGTHRFDDCRQLHIIDDVDALRDQLADQLKSSDVMVLSGGVSMGQADYVPEVLAHLGVERVFHKISQRPGKPMWFGKGPNGQLVFALPGNPVSALVCCRQYVIPALQKMSGQKTAAPQFAALASSVAFKPDLTCFQPVRLVSNASGQVLAIPVKTNTSGDFAALSATDGYVELPREQTNFDAGTSVFLHRWIAE